MENTERIPGFIGWTERVGNRMPHPFWLFIYLTFLLGLLSAWGAAQELAVSHPVSGESQAMRSLFSREGLTWILGSALTNIAQFRPLTLVLTMLVGIGLAERTGFFEHGIRRMMTGVARSWVPPAVVFAAILGNIASDVSYLILPPLGATVFAAAGRPALAGFCAALAGVGAGYTANIFVAGTDVLTAGITTQAAQMVAPGLVVSPLSNWYFMSASVVLLTILGSLLTTRWLEPRLAKLSGGSLLLPSMATTDAPSSALWRALAAGLIYALVVAAITIPERGWLHAAPGVDFSHSPFMNGIVPLLSLGFAIMGTVYGLNSGAIQRAADIPRLIGEAAREMSGFFVVAIVIAQFLAAFQWTNAGVYLAVEGADAAREANFTGLPLLVAMSLITAVLSLFVASSSSLWALLAPVFVPMAMLLGYNAAVPQLAFRISESSTNVITPLTPYLVVLVPHMQRLMPKAGLGTLISFMLPYSLLFFVAWLLLMIGWHLAGWPIGPGVPINPVLP